MDRRELFYSCKSGNLSRIRYLVEKKDVDLEAKDKWGGTPLYYACLYGHHDIVHFLLQNGVQCDANTIDGDSCLYGALTDRIRNLLKNYKVISPSVLRRDDKYNEFLSMALDVSHYSDMSFQIQNENVSAHCVILACRCSSFQDLFNSVWKDRSSINLSGLRVSSSVFQKVMKYLYLGEVNANRRELKALLAVAEYFNMTNLVTELKQIEQKNLTILHVEPRPLLQQDFMKLFLASLPKELLPEGISEEPLFIDLQIEVGHYTFSCHKVFICGRCSYLRALVTDHFSEASVSDGSKIQIIRLHDIDPHVFVILLHYIYTDTTEISPENVLDVLYFADVFILPGLKKLCASVIQENLTSDNVASVLKFVRLYNLPRLEDHCAEFIAVHLEEIIDLPDFESLILEDANEIKNKQEVDTISIIDDLRYHIGRSAQVSNCFEKNLILNELLQKLKLCA